MAKNNPKAVRAGRLARRKGASYERLITKRFREVYGDGVKRGIGQERSGGEIADVHGVPGFWLQTKHCKALNVWTALEQARVELAMSPCACPVQHTDKCSRTVKKPLVVARKDRGGDVAVLALDDFLGLLQRLTSAEGKAIMADKVSRLEHFAGHAATRACLGLWEARTERLPHSPDQEVYDDGGRLWLRNCKTCGSTISRVVK